MIKKSKLYPPKINISSYVLSTYYKSHLVASHLYLLKALVSVLQVKSLIPNIRQVDDVPPMHYYAFC